MSETKATARPWRVGYGESEHKAGSTACHETCGKGLIQPVVKGRLHILQSFSSVDDILAADGTHVVCFGHDYDDYGEVSVEDARLIVLAVNNFDEMREALKLMLTTPGLIRGRVEAEALLARIEEETK